MKHGTNAAELEQFVDELAEFELVGHYGNGWHASVKYHGPTKSYRVYDHGGLVLNTLWADTAADAYNAIRHRR